MNHTRNRACVNFPMHPSRENEVTSHQGCDLIVKAAFEIFATLIR